jgi:5'-3' exonuclease
MLFKLLVRVSGGKKMNELIHRTIKIKNMGIKGLNQLLKRVCESTHITLVPIGNFAYKKIAIDAALYVCVFKNRHNYVEAIVEFLTTLRENRIHPFFVFDGIAPEEKRNERIHRANKRAAARERIAMLERDLETYTQTGKVSDALRDVDSRVKSLIPSRLCVRKIIEYIDRLKSQILVITPQDFETLKSLLSAFDIPYTTAEGEGEFLCAALARHGIVDAVMSCDTDVFACLSPTTITRIEGDYFHVVSLAKILEGLKLTETEFIDLCIMCGTDFNPNIPDIGFVKSYNYISKYKSIDELPKELDTSLLIHERVRNLFNSTSVVPDISVPYSGRVNYEQVTKLIEYTNISIESLKLRLKPPKVIKIE